ncbi:GspH/FimT family protein [Microbulbifer sp. CAU 1566]|uniref:GspH/FimT family protein n=1 Tax=Microbulbifer sp. CAU 1566 TaxID=2933269 RepID=UPI002006CA94|nr:GspH/FimT family protein [Microbulbifer sp. CAU 1566]MCK7598780.1 GspH/FimT family protein [Microbulbifer sp. CAU 1566]
MCERGLTLIELLITLSILSVLLLVATPRIGEQIEASRTRAAADQLLQAIQLTRNKAVTTNRRATLRKIGNWEAGWEIFYDRDFDGERDGDEPAIAIGNPIKGVEIKANGPLANYVSFVGTGESRTAGTLSGGALGMGSFTICSANGQGGYKLTLANTGRVRQQRISVEDC